MLDLGGFSRGVVKKGGALTGRIESIDIDTEIDGFRRADSVSDFLDDARRPDRVDFAGLDDFETAVAVVVVVAEAGEGGADAGVNVGVVGEETFFVGVVEVCPVVD